MLAPKEEKRQGALDFGFWICVFELTGGAIDMKFVNLAQSGEQFERLSFGPGLIDGGKTDSLIERRVGV